MSKSFVSVSKQIRRPDKYALVELEMPGIVSQGQEQLRLVRTRQEHLMVKRQSPLDRFLRFFSSLKCGLLLLGLVGTSTILGTLILQRPMAREGQIEQLYAPQTIRILNALGLFDVFHAWWFMLLLGLLGANITLTSLERFPQVWRLFARPHVLADAMFVHALPFKREIPLGRHSADEALQVATTRLHSLGFKPRLESRKQGTLYIEKYTVEYRNMTNDFWLYLIEILLH